MSRIRSILLLPALAAGLSGAAALTATPADAATPACAGTDLRIVATAPEGGDGHGGLVLRFKNETRRSCTLRGYPGLDAVTRHGHVLASARRTRVGYFGGDAHPGTVVLPAAGFASATVEWTNFDPDTGGDCIFVHHIAVTPANTTRTVRRFRTVSECDLQVHPTVAGTSGRG